MMHPERERERETERQRERERDGASPRVNRPVCKECSLTPAAVGQIWFEAEAVVP